MIREANVAGVLFVGRIYPRMLCDIRDSGVAVAAIDHTPRIKGVASIQIDNRGGGALAARHFLELGHRRFAFVGCPSQGGSIVDRGEAFFEHLEAHGVRPEEREELALEALNFRESLERSQELFRRNRDVTAIFCANDEIAAGVLRAAREGRRSVPGDVSVIGFDDIIMSNYTDPPLTTMSADKQEMGRRATTRLIDLVEGVRTDTDEDVLPVALVERSSTGPPRKRRKRAPSTV